MSVYTCPICGFDQLGDRPRTPSGGRSLEYCPSCGFQFGWHDDDQGISDEDWRAQWIKGGMQWAIPEVAKPPGWNPKVLLDRLLAQ